MNVTTVSRPRRQMNSALLPFGAKCISGGGAFGGGIDRRDFSNCFLKANFAAACLCASVNVEVSVGGDCLAVVFALAVAPFVCT